MKQRQFRKQVLHSGLFSQPQRLSRRYVASLFGDYTFVLECPGYFWQPHWSVYGHLFSKRFAEVMNRMFCRPDGSYNGSSLANSFLPRKLRRDKAGCLATGMPMIESFEDSFILVNSGEEVQFPDLIAQLRRLESVEDLQTFLYQSRSGNLLASVEGDWVLLYLCLERGFTFEQTIQEISKDNVQPRSRNEHELNEAIFEEMSRAYESTS